MTYPGELASGGYRGNSQLGGPMTEMPASAPGRIRTCAHGSGGHLHVRR